jgi:hypothetical protein
MKMVIHIGWDNVDVYPNENGDVCISQQSPIEGREVVICVPLLYCNAFINEIKKAIDHED